MNSEFKSFPLSFLQQPFWILEQLAHGHPEYNANVPLVLSLIGPLDATILEKSVNEIVRRHEVLRATFLVVDGRPTVVIIPSLTLKLNILDLTKSPEKQQQEEVKQETAKEIQENFDLIQGPLIRTKLLKLSEEKHLFIASMHHLVSDGWSIGILTQEIKSLYEAFSQDKPSALPNLPIQYMNFTLWQQDLLKNEVFETGLSYWKSYLDRAPSKLALPIDNPQPSLLTLSCLNQSIFLSHEFVNIINTFSQHQGVTPFVTMLTALKIILFKWTEQKDIIVGIVSPNRARAKTQKLIGCFVNFLPLRSKVLGNEAGLSLLHEVKTNFWQTYRYQEFPFSKILESIKKQKNDIYNSIYNVALIMHQFPFAKKQYFNNKIEANYVFVDPQVTTLDLRFIAIPENSSGGIYLECEYSSNLFKEQTIKHLLASYYQTLQKLVEHPETKLFDFQLVKELQVKLKATKSNTIGFVPPTTEIEIELADIFADVLGVKPIGIYDNFFSLGGELSHASRLFNHLKETFQINLGVASLIQNPTIAGLASIIQQYQVEETELISDLEQFSNEEIERLLEQVSY